jgi:gluconate 5-dehydrogenase
MHNNPYDLTGRVALITGGSKGLGKATAQLFARAGADIVISSRHEDELKTAIAHIREGTSVRTAYFVADMTNRTDVKRLADDAVQAMGRVDILVNNAGSNAPQEMESITDDKWDYLLELNLTSCMVLSRALIPGMKSRKWGRIIHLSSVMAFASAPGRSAYSATKAGLVGMTHAMALELGPYKITVNCVAPGPILTDLPMSLLSDEQKKSFAVRTALGRWGEPHEIAAPTLMLASDAGSYITGTTIHVDGGMRSKTFG